MEKEEVMGARRIYRLAAKETRSPHQLRMWVAQLGWLSKCLEGGLFYIAGTEETWRKPARLEESTGFR